MTNINCAKKCKYQIDGKCSCDSVMLPFLNAETAGDPECPYQAEPHHDIIKKDLL
ncbi:MAG: hypothetical protein IKD21_03950 [Clostridia bacterium]|nr:hypothetical protein [Clostridia bacterium]